MNLGEDFFYWKSRHDVIRSSVRSNTVPERNEAEEWRISTRVRNDRCRRIVGVRTNQPQPGWYWFRGKAHEADAFIVLVDEAGQFQWPDGGFQEVSLARGEWAGPIQEPKE